MQETFLLDFMFKTTNVYILDSPENRDSYRTWASILSYPLCFGSWKQHSYWGLLKTRQSQTWALWYILVPSPILSPLLAGSPLPQTPWLPTASLALNWVNSNGSSWTIQVTVITTTCDRAHWNVLVSLSQDISNKDKTPNNALGQTSGSHLSTKCPNQQVAPSSHLSQTTGHCLKAVPFRVKNPGNPLPHKYTKYKSNLPMSLHILTPQY